MLGLSRPIIDPTCHQAVCCRADGGDVVAYGMPWRTAGKSACHAGELVDPEPLDAVRRHLPL